MLQSQPVENPIYKIQRKQFLKKSSIEKDHTIHLNPLLQRSKQLKERSASSRKHNHTQPLVSRQTATQTEQTMNSYNKQLMDVRGEKEQLLKQLLLKQSQFLQLKLRHIDLKQKYENVLKHTNNNKQDNSYDFGDISNISVTNSASSKAVKSMELSALKQRLQNIKIDKLLHKDHNCVGKGNVLPAEV